MTKGVRQFGSAMKMGWLVGASWMAVSTAAAAQSTAEAAAPADEGATQQAEVADAPLDDADDTIIVTARKRSEKLLDVPVSISVVSAETIERSGAKDMEDLARSVPNVVVEQGAEQDSKRFLMRGIGASSGTASTVALYVDDTPVTSGTETPDLKLFDVERVEVLRGPQGTLFGSSAMGGAIRYISPRPSLNAVSATGKAEVSFIDGGGTNYEVQAAGGAPIVDGSVAVRGSAFYRRDGGYIDVVDEFTGDTVDKNSNTVDTFGGRLAVLAKLNESIDVTASVLYQDQERNNLPVYFTGRGVTTTVPLDRFERVERAPVNSDDEFLMPNLTIQADLGGVSLTSSSSYVRRRYKGNNDFSFFVQGALGLPDPMFSDLVVAGQNDRKFESWIQEVRLGSNGDNRLNWQVGVYYQKTEQKRHQFVSSENLEALAPPLGPLIPDDTGMVFTSNVDPVTKQLAGFGELEFKATDKLKLTAGLRVTHLKTALDREADGLFNGGFSEVHEKSSETPVTPKFSVSYEPTANSMLYVTAAKGFREGGPNAPVPTSIPACDAGLDALGLDEAPAAYDSDSLWSYELGGKYQSSNRRFGVNAAIYKINWSKIQQSIGLAGCGFGFTDNVGEAKVLGFEAETYFIPVKNLRVDLRLGLAEAELAEDLITGAAGGVPIVAAEAGTTLPYTPKWTAGGAIQYDVDLSQSLSGYIRAQFDHVGKATRDLGTPSDDPRSHNRDSYNVGSLRAAVLSDKWEAALFVDNIFNAHPVLFESFQDFAPGTASSRSSIRPRTIGASVSVRY